METITSIERLSEKSTLSMPKVIHYCWFGRSKLPDLAQRCIDSWKKYLPDYEIKEWNEDNFDISINKYVKQAYGAKKYAFVSDYARMWILYNFGGIYFDVDVEVIKPFDDIIAAGAFMGCEGNGVARVNPGLGIAVDPGNHIYKEIIDSYINCQFIKSNGKFNLTTIVDRTTAILRKHGLKDSEKVQQVNSITIYPSEYLSPKSFDTGKLKITLNTHSIHWYDSSWLPKYKKIYQPLKHILPDSIRKIIQTKTLSDQFIDNKRVGIVTFQDNNYGTRLQNYALCEVLRSHGYTPITIKPRSIKGMAYEYIRKNQAIFLPFGEKAARWHIARHKERIFKRFVKIEINPVTLSRKKLRNFGDSLSKVICGSDQIWNPEHMTRHKQDIALYFLEFVQKEKRIAYAPSFGKSNIPEKFYKSYATGLNGFDSLSIREDTGRTDVYSIIGKNVEIMPDPTFLLPRRKWIDMSNKKSYLYKAKKYILIYFLSNQSECNNQYIIEYAHDNGYEIINIAGNIFKKDQIIPEPDEFLSLINNANAVFTDSYHAMVFSIIFNTPFIAYDRVDVEQSSRIHTLLKQYSLESLYNCDPKKWNFELNHNNFLYFSKKINKERQKGLNYIFNSLNHLR